MKQAQIIIEAYRRLKGERANLNMLWEEIAEVIAPERVGFTGKVKPPLQATDKVFDTVPIVAKRGLVNSLGAMLRPKSSAAGKWFDIVPEDEKLLDDREVKSWIEFAEDRLWRAIYNPKADFISSTGELDDDIVTFGTATGAVLESPDKKNLLFRSFHMANVIIEVDTLNRPTGVYICEKMTAKQAARKFGEDNLGQKTKEALRQPMSGGAPEEKFEFIWCVKDRYDRDPRIKNNRNMPWSSIFVDVESEHIVAEEGFDYYPFLHPRWDTRSGEVYGRGPGVLALPDVKTLNEMGKTMLRALHRAVDPPWLLPADSMVNAPQMFGGGVSYYDAKAIRNLGLSQPFQQMDSRANIPWGLDAQSRLREGIHAVFYKNILNLPVDAPQMTATEVIERREEFVREIGAVFGRLETDYTMPLVENTFHLMVQRGSFGRPDEWPEALQGSSVTFRFASPVEKAKKQIEEAGVMQGIDKVLAIGQVKPEIMNRFNWDEVGKFIAESGDFPAELTFDDKSVETMMMQQQQQAQAQQMLNAGDQLAGMAQKLPDRMLEAQVA